jgi:hypothetical protein
MSVPRPPRKALNFGRLFAKIFLSSTTVEARREELVKNRFCGEKTGGD